MTRPLRGTAPPPHDAVTLPAGFPARLPGPPRNSRLLGAAADASEDRRSRTILYTVRIACDVPYQDVRAHYVRALRRAGYEVSDHPAGADRFDVDAVVGYRGSDCAGEVLVAREGARSIVTLSAVVAGSGRASD